MALKDDIENAGGWLFRWRSYLPLLVIGLFLSAMPDYEYIGGSKHLDHIWEVFCIVTSFFGLAIRIVTIGHVPARTSGRNAREQLADTLNTSGMYSMTRNPLYLGNFFMGLGIALFEHTWWITFIYILIFWLYYERIILAEEAYLSNKFGYKFHEWAKKTPVFVPKPALYRTAELPFSLKKALRQEYNGFFSLVIVMYVFETVGDFFAEGKFDFDISWKIFLSISFLVWLTLRTLKKHTSLLNEEGR